MSASREQLLQEELDKIDVTIIALLEEDLADEREQHAICKERLAHTLKRVDLLTSSLKAWRENAERSALELQLHKCPELRRRKSGSGE